MRKVFILLLVVFPVVAAAQENSSLRPTPSYLQPQDRQQTARPAAQSGTVPTPPRPKPEGSMVGYIDNAIVGSELRFRFDAGFHTEFPDRAEFFYAKCGCYQALAGSGLPAYDPNAPGPKPGVATDLNYQEIYAYGEYAPNSRISFFGELPVRWLQPKSFVPDTGRFSNQSGLADIRAGFKLAMYASDDSYVTFQFRAFAPTGDASQGLGTDHPTIEPSVLYYQKLGSRAALESEFSFWHPISGSAGVASTSNSNPDSFAGNVLFYGVGPSYELYNKGRTRFAPVVELAGWHVLGGFQTVWVAANRIGDEVAGTNIVNLKMGGRLSVGRSSIYAGYGRGLTNDVWYKDLFRAEYRYSF